MGGVVDPWTHEEDSLLLSSHADGLSDRAIAALLDRSETATRKRRQRLGAVAPMVPVDREALLQLHAEGLDSRAISERLGCTTRTVQQLVWVEERARKIQRASEIWGLRIETWRSSGAFRWVAGTRSPLFTVGGGETEAEALEMALHP